MKPAILKSFLPHLLAVAFFLGLTMAYLSPVLKGKELQRHDYTVWKSSAKEAQDFKKETGETTLWTGTMFGGLPMYLTSPVRDKVFLYIHKTIKVWKNENMGHLFLYLIGFYIALLVFRVKPWLAVAGAVAFAFSSYFFIIMQAGHGTKAFTIGYMPPIIAGAYLALKRKPLEGALLMAVFLALQIRVNHFQITYYTGLVVITLGIIWFIKAIKEKMILQFTKSTIFLLIGTFLAIGVNLTSIYTTYEYGKYSIRGPSELTHDSENQTTGLDKDYATDWSYGVGESFTFLVPNFNGGASAGSLSEDSEMFKLFAQAQGKAAARKVVERLPLYWGPQPVTSGPVYVGAIVCFLFVLGLFVLRGPIRTWLIAITVISFVLGWGRNLMSGDLIRFGLIAAGAIVAIKALCYKDDKKKQNIFYLIAAGIAVLGIIISGMLPEETYNYPFSHFVLDYLPGYNKFRTVSMTLVIAELSMPLMGILAIAKVLSGEVEKPKFHKALYWSAGITGGLSLLLVIISGSFSYESAADAGMQQQIVDALRIDRQSLLKADALRSFVFVLLGAALMWAVYNKKIKETVFYPVLIALLLFDMWPINKRYLNDSHFVTKRKFEEQFNPTKADQIILEDADPNFRVLNLAVSTFNDATTSHFHKSIGGYHGAKMRRYQELIDFHISTEIQNIARKLNTQPTNEEVYQAISENKVLNMLNTKYLILNPEGYPLQNQGALGNAWFAQNIIMVNNADEEIDKLYSFNPEKDVVVDKRFSDELEGFKTTIDSTSSIDFEVYKPNYLKYATKSNSSQLAVFSEIYYPKGWYAYIDGEPADYFRVNYLLRAMIIPAGEHEIEWRFDPKSVKVCNSVSYASSSILLLLALGIVGLNFRKKFNGNDEEK